MRNQDAELKDEDELKEYLRGTKFEPVLDRLTKRAENGDARMRNGLSKADKRRILEKLQGLKEELESLRLWAAADELGTAIALVCRRKSY
jgi:prephenate dehydrogenase